MYVEETLSRNYNINNISVIIRYVAPFEFHTHNVATGAILPPNITAAFGVVVYAELLGLLYLLTNDPEIST